MYYLEKVHVAEQARRFPRQIFENQQPCVAVSRSLCIEFNIMLFDEPTFALDPEMIKEA